MSRFSFSVEFALAKKLERTGAASFYRPVADLRIFCEARFDEAAMKILREGVAPHRLIVAPTDSELGQIDLALGQLEVARVGQAGRLRWLHVTSAGFTRYDTPEFRAVAAARGLMLTNSSSVYEEPCAEHVFAFMLAQARQLPLALQTRSPGGSEAWTKLRHASSCLAGQEVVILGFGRIAARLIELLAPFKMKITAMRRQPRGDEGVAIVGPEALAAALATADHVVSILPDNVASLRFASKERLGQMKPGTVFYNIGRGTTVDQEALAESLRAGHLAAAWLDVTDPEPLPEGHPLLLAPNCFITPHTAGGHPREPETLVRHFLDNFQRFVQGAPLVDRIM